MSANPQVERWVVRNIVRELGDSDETVVQRACDKAAIPRGAVIDWAITRRSIDARGKRPPRFLLSVALITEPLLIQASPGGDIGKEAPVERPFRASLPASSARPVIVGFGPAGLFAALHFAECGLRPIIIERGQPVEIRAKDVSRLMSYGELNTESNLCYGEGGAGTWSDGKLYTRLNSPWIRHVLEEYVRFGAPEDILVSARPHMGTDRLVRLLKNSRAALSAAGCELRFDEKVVAIERDAQDRVTAVQLACGERIETSHVIFAVGHSARDMYTWLQSAGVELRPKAFAVGFRIEHPQALIDESQYGDWADHEDLPAAYYELTTTLASHEQRGVYSFCMCPGGSVVPTPAREGELCVNGMSHAARSGRYANSALVVTVSPQDARKWAQSDDVLAGMFFQQQVERAAYDAGGGAYVAPAQRMVDFMAGRPSREVRKTTYKRGVQSADVAALYPDDLIDTMKEGSRSFDRRLRGFISDEAVLIGVETRTSAPLTIWRDPKTLQSPSLAGFYPCGEGAGYGGGIMSAAIDGLRVATHIVSELAEASGVAGA